MGVVLALQTSHGGRPGPRGSGRLGDTPPTTEDLTKLPYTQALVREVMRLYPPAWIIQRDAIQQDRIGGFTIPAKSTLAISPYVCHRNPEFWPDPETFKPERFLGDVQHPFLSYLPFGAGPRSCMGVGFAMQEATIVLATLAARFRLTIDPDHRVEPNPTVTLRTTSELPMTLELL